MYDKQIFSFSVLRNDTPIENTMMWENITCTKQVLWQ